MGVMDHKKMTAMHEYMRKLMGQIMEHKATEKKLH